MRDTRPEQAPSAGISATGPETAFSDRSNEVRELEQGILEIEGTEPEMLALLRTRVSRFGSERRKLATAETSVLRWWLERSMAATLEFLQETPWKLQGEIVVCQLGISLGLGSEFLKETSCWESLRRPFETPPPETAAAENGGEMRKEMKSMVRCRVWYKGWWKRLLSAFIFFFPKIGFLWGGLVFPSL